MTTTWNVAPSVQNQHMSVRSAASLAAEAAFRARLAELGATLLESTWLGANKQHRVRCVAGHDCTPLPANVRNGHGICWPCHVTNRTQSAQSIAAEAAFRARLAELGATLLESDWLGSHTKHRVRCAAGHDCSPYPGHVRQGQGICQKCAAAKPTRSAPSIAAEAAFRARLAELGATLLESDWLGSHTKHRVRCAAGHDCSPYPADVQQGQGICGPCARNDPRTAEAAFRARLAELGATLLEPTWLGANKQHRARCAAGHDCLPLPNSVQQGGGICWTCSGRNPRPAEAAFRARLAELGATLLEPTYLGAHGQHQARCAAGHKCLAQPNKVQQGHGICHRCAGREWDTFYVVTNDAAARLKFGKSSNGGRHRLAIHRRVGYRHVERLLTGLPGDIASQLEDTVLETLRLAGVQPVYGREYYDAGALGLVLDVVDNYPWRLTTKSDHNRTRRDPIPADPPWLQAQVSDDIRQPARILQAGGHR